jgi:phage baseplate assembly protein W
MPNLDLRMRLVGQDLGLFFRGPSGSWEDGDLDYRNRGRARDLVIFENVDAADQMLINRLKTHKGELTPLGHPEYGSRHHQLIGEPNVERTRQLIKLHVLEALSHEPRLEKILRCDVTADHDPPRDVVRIRIDVKLIGEQQPRNLVVPFSLETSA